LEIGSFKGKSTILLAKGAALADGVTVNAVDPMTSPSETDPDLRGEPSSLDAFEQNIERHGVADQVVLHQMFSYELGKTWDRPLRLLWIDGDHSYRGTLLDFEGFAPHLADGAIVAFHDVLRRMEGGTRVFMEHILLSPNFGSCGFCGSIAWAQFHDDPSKATAFSEQKRVQYKKLERTMPYLEFNKPLSWIEKRKYKVWRALVPNGPVDPQKWVEAVN
jgi:hypothetical protein